MADGTATQKRRKTRGYSRSRFELAKKRAARDLKRGRIDQAEHDRIVEKADEGERERLAAMPARTQLHGVVGHVDGFYELIDARLRELDMSWKTLARQVPCAVQYLFKLTKSESVPYDMFLVLCQNLGIDPDEHVRSE